MQDVASHLSGSTFITGGGSQAYQTVARDVLGVLVESGDLSVDEFGRYHKTATLPEQMEGWEFCVNDLEMSALFGPPGIVFRYAPGEVLAALFYLYIAMTWKATNPDCEWVDSPDYRETMQQACDVASRYRGV